MNGTSAFPPDRNTGRDAGDCRLDTPGCRSSRQRRSNRELAAAAGISERHFYRLRKQATVPTSEGGARLYSEMVGPMLMAELLSELGYNKLLGTAAHVYMDKFVTALALHLAALHEELPEAIEAKLAHRTAKRSVDELRGWWIELNGLKSERG